MRYKISVMYKIESVEPQTYGNTIATEVGVTRCKEINSDNLNMLEYKFRSLTTDAEMEALTELQEYITQQKNKQREMENEK